MRVYRPEATKPIPAEAKIDRRKRVVTYRVRGKTRKAALTADGKRMRIATRTWRIEFKDHFGRRQTLSAFTHEGQSRLLAGHIERLVSLCGQPLPTDLARTISKLPSAIRERLTKIGLLEGKATVAGRTLEELLTEYEQSLRAQERSAQHIYDTLWMCRTAFEDLGLEHWGDIEAGRIEAYLSDLRKGALVRDGRQVRALSHRRSNAYLVALKGFCNWLCKRGYALDNPLTPLRKLNVKTDPRHTRRALDVDELRRLLNAAATGQEVYGMSGHERYLLYRFAIETGLRANEIRALTKAHFDFDNHTVAVEARTTKGKRHDVQHITEGLSVELESFMTSKLPEAKAFGGRYMALTDKTAPMLRVDLKAADIPYTDEAGKVFDFHALRGQCATLLAANGVSLKTAQTIMRHTDVNLTANIYTHVLRGQEAQAVASLPDLSLPNLQAEQAAKTGTNDTDVTPDVTPKSLRKVYAQDKTHTDKSGQIGMMTRDSGSKTPLLSQNQGSSKTSNPKVAGSSPAGRVSMSFPVKQLHLFDCGFRDT